MEVLQSIKARDEIFSLWGMSWMFAKLAALMLASSILVKEMGFNGFTHAALLLTMFGTIITLQILKTDKKRLLFLLHSKSKEVGVLQNTLQNQTNLKQKYEELKVRNSDLYTKYKEEVSRSSKYFESMNNLNTKLSEVQTKLKKYEQTESDLSTKANNLDKLVEQKQEKIFSLTETIKEQKALIEKLESDKSVYIKKVRGLAAKGISIDKLLNE